jgi:hypothetical protein
MSKRNIWFVPLLAALIGAQPIVAQGSADDDTHTFGQGFFMIGWQQLDVDELNTRLEANGFPSLSENLLSLGGGGWAVKNDFLIGGEGHGLIGREETTSDGEFMTRLSGGYGQLDLGYRVFASERLGVSPILGIGAGAAAVDLVEVVDDASRTFDDVLSDPLTRTRLTAAGFLFDLSVMLDVRIARNDDEGGFAFGTRVGYAYSPDGWDWQFNDGVEATGGPDVGIRGFYVRVMVGGWNR